MSRFRPGTYRIKSMKFFNSLKEAKEWVDKHSTYEDKDIHKKLYPWEPFDSKPYFVYVYSEEFEV